MTDKQDFINAKKDARTGQLEVPSDPINPNDAASKNYVDTEIAAIDFGSVNTEVIFNDGGTLRGSNRFRFVNSRGSLEANRFGTNAGGNGSVMFGQSCLLDGNYSLVGGYSSEARGTNTFSYGSDNVVTSGGEDSAAVGGFGNSVSGIMNLATGSSNIITGERNFVCGTSNNISGDFSLSSGQDNVTSSDHSLTCGILNENEGGGRTICGGSENVISAGANSIIVGYRNQQIGTGDGHNLMVGLENVSGDLSGRGIIGGRNNNVTGSNCIASGFNNTISGGANITQGRDSTNSGLNSICVGDGNQNSGQNAICVGLDNFCTSDNGICLGQQNSCTGFQSICIGRQAATRNGNYGLAIGRQALASSSECIAIGKINSSSSLGSNISIGACSSTNPRITTSGSERVFLYGRNSGNYDDAVQIIAGPDTTLKTATIKDHGNTLTWSYTPTTPGNWISAPASIGDALDSLATGGASIGLAANITFTGPWAANQTGAFEARRSGSIVTFRLLTFSAPANSTAASLVSTTGVPTSIRPATTFEKLIRITNNGTEEIGTLIMTSAGVITISTLTNGTLNQALGTNQTGVGTEITINYDVNF